ncbi:chromate efflux transporter [Blastococcus sp. KM273129]|uniref:chromate efflux transporter n=1 Tax=Blastococcus sp. KM273129 TaxID=2570315 RepID=UPI001F00F2AE|nr:chromate efflux transporter [Blastococcus sp. KM273129]MCF6737011.1 chromate efflux transporter [Blastococcus sp. KM273129]
MTRELHAPKDPAPPARDLASDADAAAAASRPQEQSVVPFRSAVRAWFLISLQTFGGPAGQIAVMQRTLVDEKRWIGQRRFLHALNYCTLLPGPEAQQLATYVGWLLHGTRGGLLAGGLFVLPGVVALLALSAVYVGFGDTTAITAVFTGLAAAVLAIVVQAVIRVANKALDSPALIALAVASFLALALFGVPFPVVVALAGVAGWALGRWWPPALPRRKAADGADAGPPPVISDDVLHHEAPTSRRTVKVLLVGLLVWGVPIALAAVLTGAHSVFTEQGLFFSGAAVVTFGGAYAVLAYVAQQAVTVYGWLSPGEMVRGLALAETTPGPLIMVVQFVAFLGAYRAPGDLDPWVAAVLASLLVTWVTFVPSFLFVLLGAPYMERLRGNRSLSAALTGITAAVVGVIANLGVYFAVHTLFSETVAVDGGPLSLELPVLTTLRPVPLVIAVVAAVLLFRVKWSVLRTLGVCAVLGLVAGLAGLPIA